MGRGRGGRNVSESTMEQPKRVKLSDQQLLAKGKDLTRKLGALKIVKRDLSAKTRAAKEDRVRIENEIEALREELESGYELRPQGDLFAQDIVARPDPTPDPTLPKDQAAAALGKVAEVAGLKGPSDPHDYLGVAAEIDKCSVCESTQADLVHHGGDPAVAALKPHAFVAPVTTVEGEVITCDFGGCSRPDGHDVHACDHGVSPSEWCNGCKTTTEAARTPHPFASVMVAEVDTCAVCTSAHAGARIPRIHQVPPPVEKASAPLERACPSCKQGTCIVHAHPFRGEEGGRCPTCDKVAKAKIHRAPEGGWPEPVAEADVVRMPAEGYQDETQGTIGAPAEAQAPPPVTKPGNGHGKRKPKAHAQARRGPLQRTSQRKPASPSKRTSRARAAH